MLRDAYDYEYPLNPQVLLERRGQSGREKPQCGKAESVGRAEEMRIITLSSPDYDLYTS